MLGQGGMTVADDIGVLEAEAGVVAASDEFSKVASARTWPLPMEYWACF